MAGKPLCDEEILEAIDNHWREFLFPPPIQYLIENSCILSKNTIWLALRRLQKAGKIKLVRTGEGYKAYSNWAHHALDSMATRLKDEIESREER